jgi:glyoxylase-like metal-dependent hydrolase (beta-lactamase superfamily II)
MEQILPGIHAWSIFSSEKDLDFNGHLVVADEGCVLIDPPPMGADDLEQADRLGPPAAIVITNRHHSRDAARAAARWRIPILVHESDAKGLPEGVAAGGTFRDGDRLPSGLLVVTLSDQKSPGESALLCRKADAIVLGDALIGKPAGRLRMLPEDKYADPARALAGLRRLLDFPFESVLVGDGASVTRGGRRAIVEFLDRGQSRTL